ncbi:MAG: SCO family protein [Verrucomicrobia bacterium]|nr:SCO family protein [Verrucomicrobiota bacterium]
MTLRELFLLAAVPALLLGFAWCGKKTSPAPGTPPVAGTAPRVFTVKGVVMEQRPGARTVVIRHEAIPDYMPAMTMPFTVRDTNDLRNLIASATVQFRYHVTDDDSWIDEVALIGGAPQPEQMPSRFTFRRVRDVEPLAEGMKMPEYHFTNELGRAFSLGDFKGQALAITFIFTLCPQPDFCPRLSKNFSTAQELLKERAGGPTNWHLLSLSFDVQHDTPQVLLGYAKRNHYDPQSWSFATGALIDIDAITEQFGMTFARQAGTIFFDHNLRTVVVDATGKIQKIFTGNTWKPTELVEEMAKAATAK